MTLHLRSRRIGSNEAVFELMHLFSTLLARLYESQTGLDGAGSQNRPGGDNNSSGAGRRMHVPWRLDGDGEGGGRGDDTHRHGAVMVQAREAVGVLQRSLGGRQVRGRHSAALLLMLSAVLEFCMPLHGHAAETDTAHARGSG